MRRPRIPTPASGVLALSLLASQARAHEHHGENIPSGAAISPEPIDSILWWHICAMVVAFGILFPVGMVLGIVRSRWHVPLQAAATVIAVTGWFLGHAHKGRQFAQNIHASFASSLMSMLAIQAGLGVYLKLHLEKGFHGRIRRFMVPLHGILGKAMPVVAWVQMLFGGITALGFCRADHQGQCLAHFIMGSSFIAYGVIMTIMLLVGQAWLRRTGRSQEFWDSLVITLWGMVNTFTEHRWGHAWAHNDIQHTSMGIVWWCAGLLGLWLSKGTDRRPKRNVVPGLVILLTGYAMSGHAQHLPLSTMVHAVFGYTLMAAGLARIVEVCFIDDGRKMASEPNNFQHLPPFLLFAGGYLFMCATEEQLALVDSVGIDHVSYILVVYSLAFLTYLFTQVLLYIFMSHATEPKPTDPEHRANGVARDVAADRRVADAEEFELEGLISDEEGSQVGEPKAH